MLTQRLALATLSVVVFVATAQAQPAANPYDAEQRRLSADVERLGRDPRAVLRMLELWSNWELASPGTTTRELARLGASTRLSAPNRVYARMLQARSRIREGAPDEAERTFDELGFVDRWRVVGPFDNEGKQGFERAFDPEAHRNDPPELDAQFEGRERPVSWRLYPEITRFGYVNFDAVMRPYENVCGYAETFVQVDRARPISLWVGAGGAVKVWFNGEPALSDAAYRGPDAERHAAVVFARAGWNRVLVKTCVTESTWGFFLRVAEADGSAPRGLRIDPMQTAAAAAPASPPRLPALPVAPLATLEAAAAAATPTADAIYTLAEYLWRTGSDDPAERRAKQLAVRAVELEPSLDRLELAARLQTERAERVKYVLQAVALAPSDPHVLLMHADLIAGGAVPEDCLPVLDRIPATALEFIDAQLMRARLLRALGLPEAARQVTEETARRAPGSIAWLRARVTAAETTGRRDAQIALQEEVLRGRFDDTSVRRALLADALERGDFTKVGEHLAVMQALDPDSSRTLYFVAAVHDGLGHEDEALAAYRAAVALAPEDSIAHVQLGRALLRFGQRDAAADSLRLAMRLRPQDADTRELLEQLAPEQRADEAYAVDERTLLARRRERSEWSAERLQDLTVNTVYQNGLGSQFRQVAVQVFDAESARRWRAFPIPFDPEAQRVDVRLARVYRADGSRLESSDTYEQQLGEPWYRIYYDTRQLVVIFPDLEPGDTIELRYRVDDTSHRNLFADYYGDLHFFQGSEPVRHGEYVLVTPTSREFFFNDPSTRLTQLTHEQRVVGETRIDRFAADDIEAIRSEEGMPGYTEIAPYLHVSTYRTWQDVGHWWWGLIRDQLNVDESLRRTVTDLVRGAPDVRTKVQRIYDWVIRHTRYVGLEFGIHGYKPYRVTQIVQRGFGDCKDKASLLYAMMTAAGIDARIVLVRTRRNGALDQTPASLSVFDHAIAYVPELDLYLDGTAENSGTTEFPLMDQGVSVLVVGPESAELKRTPVQDATQNRRERQLTVNLEADGAAQIQVSETVRGSEASRYRSTYQAEGTRRDRLQRALAGLFPGLEIRDLQFGTLDDYERPITYQYAARVPQLAQRDEDGFRITPSVLDDLVRVLARTPSRHYALDLGSTNSYLEERRIRLPAGMRVQELPRSGVAESAFGRLAVTFEQQDGGVTARTEFELRRDRLTAEEYPAFRQWVEQADTLLRQRIHVGGGAR